MSLVTHRDYLAQKEYYRDQMRSAAKDRLVREALAGRIKHNSVVSKSLAWLGQVLVAWGSRLQRHYADVVSSSIPRSTHPATGS
jgi:hypothetical protein